MKTANDLYESETWAVYEITRKTLGSQKSFRQRRAIEALLQAVADHMIGEETSLCPDFDWNDRKKMLSYFEEALGIGPAQPPSE
jgi:hypothetical protein